MTTISVFKVKDIATGLFMNKHGCWDKKGRTWESLGKLKLTLNGLGFYNKLPGYDNHNATKDFGDSIKIIEIKIVETEDNMTSMDDFIGKLRRHAELGKKFGQPFQELIQRIEDQGQNEQFQWVLAAKGRWDTTRNAIGGEFGELLAIVKSMKLKQNKDYKKASNYSDGGVIAFATKQQAMTARLMMSGKVTGIDIVKYVETDLDNTDTATLNSST
jgi:hypothetical protein